MIMVILRLVTGAAVYGIRYRKRHRLIEGSWMAVGRFLRAAWVAPPPPAPMSISITISSGLVHKYAISSGTFRWGTGRVICDRFI